MRCCNRILSSCSSWPKQVTPASRPSSSIRGDLVGRLIDLWFLGADVDAVRLELVGLALARCTREWFAAPGDLDVHESRPLDLRDVLSFQESTADSGSPDRDVLPARRRDVLVDHDVGDLDERQKAKLSVAKAAHRKAA